MSRLIDADELLKKTKHWKEGILTGDEILIGMIKAFEIGISETKTADAVLVVRCKDCVHRPRRMWESNDGFGLEFPDYVCPCYCDDEYYSWMPKDDFFCAGGERRTE